MPKEYIIASDVGTSGTITSLVDIGEKGEPAKILSSEMVEYDVIYPQPNFAEQDPKVWWGAVAQNTKNLMKKTGTTPDQIAAIVHSSQMLGCMPVDKHGTPLMNCMIWNDTRAAKQSLELWDVRTTWAKLKYLRRILNFLGITGAGPMTRDMYSKIMWVKEERSNIYQETYKFLDVMDWLLLKATGVYATPRDFAGVTFLMDIHKFQWSEKIASYGGVDLEKLNPITKCTDVAGELTAQAAAEMDLKPGIPVICGCGDASAAMAGSGATEENDVHSYIGSSGWLMAPVSRHLRKISAATVAVPSPNPEIIYMLVAEQKNMGACYKWFKNVIGRGESYQQLDALAATSPPGANKLIFTPWLTGEACPVIDPRLRAGYNNLSMTNTRADMVRAVLEGVSYNHRWALDEGVEPLVERNKGKIKEIRYIGGGAISDLWSQIMADILNKNIIQMANPIAAGTIGAALIAGLGIKRLSSFREFKTKVKEKAVYHPNPANREIYDRLYQGFRTVHKRLEKLYQSLNPGVY